MVDSLVLGAVKGVVPSGKDVGGAEGGHQFMAEEVGFEKLLDDEELGVEVLVTLPNVVKVAELANDVERGEHGGGEVVIKPELLVCFLPGDRADEVGVERKFHNHVVIIYKEVIPFIYKGFKKHQKFNRLSMCYLKCYLR